MADDIFLEQEVDDADRVNAVDDRSVQFSELELQHFVRLCTTNVPYSLSLFLHAIAVFELLLF